MRRHPGRLASLVSSLVVSGLALAATTLPRTAGAAPEDPPPAPAPDDAAKADLVPVSVSPSPDRVGLRGTTKVRLVVRNAGAVAAPASRAALHLVDRRGRAHEVGAVAVPEVPAGQEVSATATVTLGRSTALGEWTLRATVDADGAVAEGKEDNQTATAALRVVLRAPAPRREEPAPGAPEAPDAPDAPDVPPEPDPATPDESDPAPPRPPVGERPRPEPAPPAPAPGPRLANLRVSFADREPLRAVAGTPLEVDYVLANAGTAPARMPVVLVRLETARGGRLAVERDEVRLVLAAGAERRGRATLRVPEDAPAGPARVVLHVDPDGRVPESDDADNEASRDAAIEAAPRPALPNLQVADLAVVPASASPGDEVRLTALVRNVGEGRSAATTLSFSLLGRREGPVLGSVAVPALNAGAETRVASGARVPEDQPRGRYAARAVVDAEGRVPESSEDDNAAVAAGALEIVERRAPEPPRPGPAPTPAPREGANPVAVRMSVEGGRDARAPGSPIVTRLLLENRGGSPAPAFDVRLFVADRRPEWRAGRWRGLLAEVARTSVGAGLEPGRGATRRLAGVVPSGVAAGRRLVVAIVDPAAALSGQPREDDVATAAFEVAGLAVLASADFRVAPEVVSAGERFSVRATVENRGNAPSPDATVSVVIEPSGSRRGRRAIEVGSMPMARLRPRATAVVSVSVPVPPGLPQGRHRVALRVGDLEVASGTIAVRAAAPGIDLVAFDLEVRPNPVRAGGGLRATARIGNLGDGPAPPTRAALEWDDGRRTWPLGEADVPSVAPGEAVEVRLRGVLPPGAPEGPAWVAVRADVRTRVPQRDRDNDVAWAEVVVGGRFGDAVSLSLGPVRLSTARARPGEWVEVGSRVENAGSVPVDETDVDVRLVGAGAEWLLGRTALSAGLAPGEAQAFADRFRIPPDVPPGRYDVLLDVDPDERLPWSARTEPSLATIEVVSSGGLLPDLVAESLEPSPVPGGDDRSIGVAWSVRNVGRASASSFDVEIALASGDGRSFRLPLAWDTVPEGIARGASARGRLTLEVPAEIPDGDYRLELLVDPLGEADGVRDGRERLSRAVRLGRAGLPPAEEDLPPPMGEDPLPEAPPAPAPRSHDVALLDARVPGRATPGDVAVVEVRVGNRGAVAGRYRLTVLARGPDGRYAEWATSAPLPLPGPGTVGDGRFPVAVPAEATGRVHLRVVAAPVDAVDPTPDDAVAETDLDVSPADEPPAAAVEDRVTPVPLTVLLAGPLSRGRSVEATFLVAYPEGAERATLEATLEAGGRTWTLATASVPEGVPGTVEAVRASVRAPADAPAGAATLRVAVRAEGAPPSRPTLRVEVEVR